MKPNHLILTFLLFSPLILFGQVTDCAKEIEALKKIAIEQREMAEAQKAIAEELKIIASAEMKKAKQLKFQAVSQLKAMKIKTIDDPQLKGLIAKQTYDFYSEFKTEGKEQNEYIYSGIYYGLQGLIADEIYRKNTELGRDAAMVKGDSVLNQYHGHMPLTKHKSQVDVRSITFSKDGKIFYSTGSEGKLLKWNVETRTFTEIFRTDKVDRVIKISPDEKWMTLIYEEGGIDLFDFNNLNKPPRKLRGHRGTIYDLVFYPDNTGFITVGADKVIQTCDFETQKELTFVTSIVRTLAISSDGSLLAAGAANGEVILIDLNSQDANQKQILRERQKELPVQDLSFSDDGKYLAIGGFDIMSGNGYVIIWDMVVKKQYGPVLTGFTSPVNDVEFSNNGKYIAAASSDKTVRVWDMNPDNIYDLPLVF